MRSLTPHRQPSAVPQASVTSNVHHPFDVHLDLLPQITFDTALLIDHRPDPVNLFLGEFPNSRIRAYMGLPQNLVCARSSDPVNVGKTDLNPLVGR
jgi:hypothetical protein